MPLSLFIENHHFDQGSYTFPDFDDCTDQCGFALQLTIELCKLGPNYSYGDEDSFRDCLYSHFVKDHVSKNK